MISTYDVQDVWDLWASLKVVTFDGSVGLWNIKSSVFVLYISAFLNNYRPYIYILSIFSMKAYFKKNVPFLTVLAMKGWYLTVAGIAGPWVSHGGQDGSHVRPLAGSIYFLDLMNLKQPGKLLKSLSVNWRCGYSCNIMFVSVLMWIYKVSGSTWCYQKCAGINYKGIISP